MLARYGTVWRGISPLDLPLKASRSTAIPLISSAPETTALSEYRDKCCPVLHTEGHNMASKK